MRGIQGTSIKGFKSGPILAEERMVQPQAGSNPAERTTMSDKTKTVVVIERHEQTIIRRSRRTIHSGEVRILAEPAELGPPGLVRSGRASPDKTTVVQEKRPSLGAQLKTVALKVAPLLRRLKTRARECRNRLFSSGGA